MATKQQHGLGLIELMLGLALTLFLATYGLPNLLSLRQSLVLDGALSQTKMMMKQARAYATTYQRDTTLIFKSGKRWWVGASFLPQCSCDKPISCKINGVTQCLYAADFKGVKLSALSFSESKARLDGIRGLAIGNAGSVSFQNQSQAAKVVLSNIGRARICMLAGQIRQYSSC